MKKSAHPAALDQDEAAHVVAAVRALALSYVVLTSVDRDDLDDQGAAHLAASICAARGAGCRVEVLSPDFRGDDAALTAIFAAAPDVFAHNLETVERITPNVRDRRAGYRQSLRVLAAARDAIPGVVTKSSLMLGLGENDDEVLDALLDLRVAGVDVVTLGQYLRPTTNAPPVARILPASLFDDFACDARALGFRAVASAPLVRSSYRAAALLHEAQAVPHVFESDGAP